MSGLSSPPKLRLAVIYQELDAPLIDGVRKPKKPTGYKDSGADIAYALSSTPNIEVVTPVSSPNPTRDDDWVFGDTESSILSAVRMGATHLWANTILFDDHPLQTSPHLDFAAKYLKIIGQPPKLVQQYDDKNYVNEMLRALGHFRLPHAKLVSREEDIDAVVSSWSYFPVIGKPVRGRGSHGVKLCHSAAELQEHCLNLLKEQSSVIVEQYLAGQEGTVTVMPPAHESNESSNQDYWALPVVERFGHDNGVAPYNGKVPVTQNSRIVTAREHDADPAYADIQRQCIEVARLLGPIAPIRIDVRRVTNDPKAPLALFDINMKPNMTGPGRPGRDDQACLTALAVQGIGWDYAQLLEYMLDSAMTLEHWRRLEVPVLRT